MCVFDSTYQNISRSFFFSLKLQIRPSDDLCHIFSNKVWGNVLLQSKAWLCGKCRGSKWHERTEYGWTK